MRVGTLISRAAATCMAFVCVAGICQPQEYTRSQRREVQVMLQDVASDVKRHYYDPQFHGIDWDARVREAKAQIDSSDSLNLAIAHIAAALISLDDSHTFFVPPPRPYINDYGFQMQMIGDRCYVTRVRPGSDAEAKGVKPGDGIVAVNGFALSRKDFWKLEYIFGTLRPQPGLSLNLVTLAGSESRVDVMAKFRQLPAVSGIFDFERQMNDQEGSLLLRYAERGDDLLIVKISGFLLPPPDLDTLVGKMRKHSAVILDLRGNPGGSVETLQAVLGGMLESKVKIADRVSRGKTKAVEIKPEHHGYTGKLVVLIDSGSASASEIFARVVQLEKRGLVVGDRSAGMVMEAEYYGHEIGTNPFIFYGVSVTSADLVMTDGHSLEHQGVVPDVEVLPTATDLANGRDPALAKAAELLDVKISPEEAGKLFPYEWPKD